MQKPNLHMYLRRWWIHLSENIHFVKVCSGVLKGDDVLYNADVDAEEKPGKLYTMCGKQTDRSFRTVCRRYRSNRKAWKYKKDRRYSIDKKNTPITYSRTDYSVPYTYMRYKTLTRG